MANRIALGIETDDPKNYQSRLNSREKKLAEAVREDNNIEETFPQALVVSNMDNADGSVYTGAAGEELGFHTGKNAFECHQAAVATPAVVTPFQSSDGLEVKPVAAADALEITNGILSTSKAAYTCDSFLGNKTVYFEATIKIDDITDVSELAFGFRTAEAYQAAVNSYDTYATFNIGGQADGRVDIETELNGAGLATTDTTLTDWADAGEHTLRIEVSGDRTCKFFYDGSEPTVTANFTFDAADVIIPFLFLDTETGDPGVSVSAWNIGYV